MAQGARKTLRYWLAQEEHMCETIDRKAMASQVTLPEGVTAELNVLARIAQAEPRKAQRRYIAGRRG